MNSSERARQHSGVCVNAQCAEIFRRTRICMSRRRALRTHRNPARCHPRSARSAGGDADAPPPQPAAAGSLGWSFDRLASRSEGPPAVAGSIAPLAMRPRRAGRRSGRARICTASRDRGEAAHAAHEAVTEQHPEQAGANEARGEAAEQSATEQAAAEQARSRRWPAV